MTAEPTWRDAVAAILEEAHELAKAEREAQRAGGVGRPSSPVSAAGARAVATFLEGRFSG